MPTWSATSWSTSRPASIPLSTWRWTDNSDRRTKTSSSAPAGQRKQNISPIAHRVGYYLCLWQSCFVGDAHVIPPFSPLGEKIEKVVSCSCLLARKAYTAQSTGPPARMHPWRWRLLCTTRNQSDSLPAKVNESPAIQSTFLSTDWVTPVDQQHHHIIIKSYIESLISLMLLALAFDFRYILGDCFVRYFLYYY